jgi:hypothetical protein
VLVLHEGRVVLAADGEVAAGTKAYPVQANSVRPFSVGERLSNPSETAPGPLVMVSGSSVPVYATDLPDGTALDPYPVVVAVGKPPLPGLAVSSCTSTEGIHISLWSGSGKDRTRRWSAYVYLGYDTEPTCRDSDLAS